ncbi:hypothetical protein LUZ60_004723 [Juncus effusus]|nr:hypothetical protein LUZ60_004723 [Juncus effusus]
MKEFPGFEGEFPSKHYAGYITIGSELQKRHIYYYFAISERNPSQDPVTFWINGGPGCSALSALVHLAGPFKIESNSIRAKHPRVKQNPFSWTKINNVLFVDAPVGTGYSYAEGEEDILSNDSNTVSDLYDFLKKWYSEFPEFLSNPLYLAGCSYSGVHVPLLAQEIVNSNEASDGMTINLKGYSLGNPAIDVHYENNYIVQFAHRMGLISDKQFHDLATTCGEVYWNNTDPNCLKRLEFFNGQIKGIGKYHVLCLPCHFQMGISMESAEYESVEMLQSLYGETSQFNIYCQDYELTPERLFNSKAAREMLHAESFEVTGPWIRCTNRLKFERNIHNVIPYHLNLTSKGYRVFIYNGDHDMQIPYIATLDWIKTLNYPEIEEWHPWFVEDQIAGYAVRYANNLLFATFKGAGHTAMEFMPREALVAYQRWIDGAELL